MGNTDPVLPAGHCVQVILIPAEDFSPDKNLAVFSFFFCLEQEIIRFRQRSDLLRNRTGHEFFILQYFMRFAELEEPDSHRFTGRHNFHIYFRDIDGFFAVFRVPPLIPDCLAD